MSCCLDNADNPGAPEYQKGYKSKNNSACLCNVLSDEEETTSTETITTKTLTRGDFVS